MAALFDPSQLSGLPEFLSAYDLKDLVFLLSKCPGCEQFTEISTKDDLITAVQTWYGSEATPAAIYRALLAANQSVLASCILRAYPTAFPGPQEVSQVPSQLRIFLFKVATQFTDSDTTRLGKSLKLAGTLPIKAVDSLDLMTVLLQRRLVTESDIRLLLNLALDSAVVGQLYRDYMEDNAANFAMGCVDSGESGNNLRMLPSGCAAHKNDCYPMSNPICVILNVHQVPNRTIRTGSEKDVDRLTEVFTKFRYSVLHLIDPDRRRYFDFLHGLKANLLGQRVFDGFVFFIMSHGEKNCIELADGSQVEHEKDIVAPFLDGCLRGKPKTFFFQCCRGSQHQRVISFDGPSAIEPPVSYSDQDNADLYVFHSTFDGFVSVREEEKGSWFIQTICDKLDVPERVNIEDLRRSVTRDLLDKRGLCGDKQINQTATLVTNTQTRNLFLKPE